MGLRYSKLKVRKSIHQECSGRLIFIKTGPQEESTNSDNKTHRMAVHFLLQVFTGDGGAAHRVQEEATTTKPFLLKN
jgi:hypothetical protein